MFRHMTKAQLDSLANQAATVLRSAYRSNEGDIETAVYRTVAEYVLEARRFFTTKEGRPDWRGVTYAYRQWYGDMLGRTGIPVDDLPRIQSAMRYHVGNLLRERLDDKELETLGLQSASPRERSMAKRNLELEILNLFTGGGPISNPNTVRRLLQFINSALSRVEEDALQEVLETPEGLEMLKDLSESLTRALN